MPKWGKPRVFTSCAHTHDLFEYFGIAVHSPHGHGTWLPLKIFAIYEVHPKSPQVDHEGHNLQNLVSFSFPEKKIPALSPFSNTNLAHLHLPCSNKNIGKHRAPALSLMDKGTFSAFPPGEQHGSHARWSKADVSGENNEWGEWGSMWIPKPLELQNDHPTFL